MDGKRTSNVLDVLRSSPSSVKVAGQTHQELQKVLFECSRSRKERTGTQSSSGPKSCSSGSLNKQEAAGPDRRVSPQYAGTAEDRR